LSPLTGNGQEDDETILSCGILSGGFDMNPGAGNWIRTVAQQAFTTSVHKRRRCSAPGVSGRV
jgi:hypothetical protein